MPGTEKSHDKVDEIKSRLDIVAVVGKDVSLHYEGNNEYAGTVGIKGKTGSSLKVNSLSQTWKDHKNGPGGDVIDWIGYSAGYRDTRGSDFPDVLKLAADMAGVELEDLTEEQRTAAKEKVDIHNLYTDAAECYHRVLIDRPEICDYIFQKWGITRETIENLKIGYAGIGRNLKDLSTEGLKKSGLVYVNNGLMGGEVFQGRIIFPYWKNGKVVYLIGRATDETPARKDGTDAPKYQKLLVHKEGREYVSPAVQNSYFYGEDSIRGDGYVIITEGVADCISLLQAGFRAVSPVTVRFREEDFPKLISLVRKKGRVYICNDAEANEAGIKGALATAEALEAEDIEAWIIELPKPEGVSKIDIAEYMQNCENPKDSFSALMQEKSVRLWNYKLLRENVNPDLESLTRLKAYKHFISNDLHKMQPDEWKTFVKNEVRTKFGLKMGDVRQAIADIYYQIFGRRSEPEPQQEGAISKFDLDSASGRGEAYRQMTEDFLKHFKPVITFADTGEIRIYNDGVYSDLEKSSEAIIENYVTEDLAFQKYKTCISPSHALNVIKKIKTKTTVRRSEVDNDPYKVAVKNGILDVLTGELVPFSPEQFFISKLDVAYDPEAKPTPEFLNYFETTFAGVEWQIPVMQELLGYCLYRFYPYEFLVFFIGDGRNGKGIFFQMLGAMLGKHNVSAIALDDIVRKKSEFTVCDLYGKMVNICGEIGKSKISETRDIKLLTGKDDIRARFPHERGFLFRNYAKMFFSMNEAPEIEDFTEGMKNRIKMYEFPNEFVTGKNAIDNLEQKLTTPEALSGMLNWALEGLHRLLDNKGKLSDPRSAAQMGLVYEKKSRPMYYFVRDCIEEDPTNLVLREMLEQAYMKYARAGNLPSLSKEKIREKFISECEAVGIRTALKQVRKNQLNEKDQKGDEVAARPRVFTGIRIIESENSGQAQLMEKKDDDKSDDTGEFARCRQDMKAFAKSHYHSVTPDIDLFVTDFMKCFAGYKSKPGRQILTRIAEKCSSWGWDR